MTVEYSCHRCGKAYKSGQAVLGHRRWCRGAEGVAQELRGAAAQAAASPAASAPASLLGGAPASPAALPPPGWHPAPSLPAEPPPNDVLRQLSERMTRVEQVLGNHVEHLGARVEESQGLSPLVWVLIGAGGGFGLALLLGAAGESAPAKVGSSLGSKLLETGATTLLRKGLNKL